ncbi:MAG: ABC transporter permease [Lachnospiraceae bacterium]
MRRYIIKRILWLIPVVLGVCIFIFAIMNFVPGDPASIILGPGATSAEIAVKRAELGLDQPFIVRLFTYMKDVFLHFDFGRSYTTGNLITVELLQRLPKTAIIGLTSMVIAIIVGVPLGITAAVHQNGIADRICMIIALLGISVPAFWLALLMVIVFSLHLQWLPSSGIASWTSYILPCIASSFGGMASLARQSRSSMLEVIRSDYVTTARAKGVTERDVIYKHALPNALIPIITVAGNKLALVLGGSVVIENVFSIPGIGTYLVTAINNRDYPVIMGSVILLAIVFAVIMVLVDLIYAYVDPRIKAQYIGAQKQSKKKKNRRGSYA